MRVLVRLIAALLLCVLPACVGTPVPQPPALEEPDPTQLFNASTGGFIGGPGAVPEGDQLWIAPLDVPVDPVLTPVEPDGSFTSSLSVEPGQEVRIQARGGEGRSRPIDLIASNPAEIVRATEGCLLLDAELLFPTTRAGDSAERNLRVSNECGSDVTLTLALRRADAQWDTGAPGAMTIADGEARDLPITYRPDTIGLNEEILFVEVTAPEADRRVVTLSGTTE